MNRLSPTLSLYIGWQFIVAFVSVLLVVMGLIMLFDLIELVRRSVTADDLGMGTLFGLAALKLPHTLQDVLPFAVMIGMMFALFRLARNSELVVMRSAGVSVWQFLAPTLLLVAVLGILNLLVVNPFSASLYQTYEQLKDELFLKRTNALNIGVEGLWLRETSDDKQLVVHARGVRQEGSILFVRGVSLFEMDKADRFVRRYEAEDGQLLDGFFKLDDVWETSPNIQSIFHTELFLPTSISIGQVQESFAAPKTMSFWELPQFIRFSEEAGFSTRPHRLYWHSLLASPFLFCAMVLVASAFYLTTNNRLGGWTKRGLAGLGAGFMLYFFSRLTYALGLSAILPLPLAAWAPTTVAALLGLTYLFHHEDG
ncbi:MAG: LPS export ABC transporter permease LptG [Alphaproteobacteria bacterium]|nr:LPS export ABC transporter permease LptG [Alphaproteobacteria bacterium]